MKMKIFSQLIILSAIARGINGSITGADYKNIEDAYRQQVGVGVSSNEQPVTSANYSNVPQQQTFSPVDNTNAVPLPADSSNTSVNTQQLPVKRQSFFSPLNPFKSSSEPASPNETKKSFLSSLTSKIDPSTVKTGLKVAGLVGGAVLLRKLADNNRKSREGEDYYDGMRYDGGGYYGQSYGQHDGYAPMHIPVQQYTPMPMPMPMPVQQYAPIAQVRNYAPPPPPPPQMTQNEPIYQQLQQPYQAQQMQTLPQANNLHLPPTPPPLSEQMMQAPQVIQPRPYTDINEVMRAIQAAVSAQMAHYTCDPPQSTIQPESQYGFNPLNPRQRITGVKSIDQVIYEISKRKGSFSFPQIFLSNPDEDTLPPPRGVKPVISN